MLLLLVPFITLEGCQDQSKLGIDLYGQPEHTRGDMQRGGGSSGLG